MTYIASISIDEESLRTRKTENQHEHSVAINDLIEWNHFIIKDKEGNNITGPYDITLGATENRVTFTVGAASLNKPTTIMVSIAPFRSIIKDYFLICESYFDAVKTGNLPRIEAIDMSRRGLHNEGADLLTNLLRDKVSMDYETARRLFTLICALHLK